MKVLYPIALGAFTIGCSMLVASDRPRVVDDLYVHRRGQYNLLFGQVYTVAAHGRFEDLGASKNNFMKSDAVGDKETGIRLHVAGSLNEEKKFVLAHVILENPQNKQAMLIATGLRYDLATDASQQNKSLLKQISTKFRNAGYITGAFECRRLENERALDESGWQRLEQPCELTCFNHMERLFSCLDCNHSGPCLAHGTPLQVSEQKN